MSESEWEEFRDKIIDWKSHLTAKILTLARMSIFDDWVKLTVSLRCPLYSTLCSSVLSPVLTWSVSQPFSISTAAALAQPRTKHEMRIALRSPIGTCWNLYKYPLSNSNQLPNYIQIKALRVKIFVKLTKSSCNKPVGRKIHWEWATKRWKSP